jgi:hypothetical protein
VSVSTPVLLRRQADVKPDLKRTRSTTDLVAMTRPILIVVAVAVLLAGCGGPTKGDIARGDVIAADPIFGDILGRPLVMEEFYYGDDPLYPSDLLGVGKTWESNGTADLKAVAALVQVALDAGWVDLTVECDDRGAARASAKKMLSDGTDFLATLTIQGPHELDPDDTFDFAPGIVVSSAAARPGHPQRDPIPEDTPAIVDLGCLETLVSL